MTSQSPLFFFRLLLLVSAGAFGAATADPAGDISVSPAWGGLYHPGQSTALLVSLRPATGAESRITIATGGLVYTRHVRPKPGVEVSTWLAIAPRSDASLRITVDPFEYQADVVLQEARQPIVAYVSTGDLRLPESASHAPVVVDPIVLPDNADAFATLDALVLARSAFERMTEAQISALLAYLGNCGRMIGVGLPAATFRLLRAQAGCNSRFVANVDNAAVTTTVNALLSAKGSPLPSARHLAAIQADTYRAKTWLQAVIFVIAYVTVVLLLSGTRRHRAALAAVPVIATAIAFAVWTPSAQQELIIWSEAERGTQFARFRGLVRITGNGRGEFDLDPPIGSSQMRAVDDNALATFASDAAMDRPAVRIPVALMSRSLFLTEGTFPVNPALVLADEDDGPTIIHRGGRSVPGGMLSYAGEVFAVPRMEPGETLRIDTDVPLSRQDRVGSLLRARAGAHGALLFPLEQLERQRAAGSSSTGWLMVTASPDRDETG